MFCRTVKCWRACKSALGDSLGPSPFLYDRAAFEANQVSSPVILESQGKTSEALNYLKHSCKGKEVRLIKGDASLCQSSVPRCVPQVLRAAIHNGDAATIGTPLISSWTVALCVIALSQSLCLSFTIVAPAVRLLQRAVFLWP